MRWMGKRLLRLLVDEDGPTAIEYALIVFLLILVVLTGITWWGQTTATNFDAHVR